MYGSSKAERGWIDSPEWRQARLVHLAQYPLCVHCEEQAGVTLATDVDHIIPHRGNYDLFWDRNNWQSLCKSCHSRKTATEDGGFGHARKADSHRFVITGPPGAGKTTWVNERATPDDLVWDLDRIAECMSGHPKYPRPAHIHRALMAMRGGLVMWLAQSKTACSVFVIVSDSREATAIAKRIHAKLVALEKR